MRGFATGSLGRAAIHWEAGFGACLPTSGKGGVPAIPPRGRKCSATASRKTGVWLEGCVYVCARAALLPEVWGEGAGRWRLQGLLPPPRLLSGPRPRKSRVMTQPHAFRP